jgi:nitrogenase molybdenum-iron protein NifN
MLDRRRLPAGGTAVADLARLSGASAAVEFGLPVDDALSGGRYLAAAFGAELRRLPLPVGVRATDAFFATLAELSGRPAAAAAAETAERDRLLDAHVDAHKRLSGRRALVYGDADQVAALAAFGAETGLAIVAAAGEGRDFAAVEAAAAASAAAGAPIDLLIGNSKGYKTAVKLGAPLVRLGFPVHDRFGGQRLRSLGYGGSLELLDRVVNALIERAQEDSDVGYTYY